MPKEQVVTEWLLGQIAEMTGESGLDEQAVLGSSLNEVGIHSILYIKLIVAIEQEFHISFHAEALMPEEFGSVRELAEHIAHIASASEGRTGTE